MKRLIFFLLTVTALVAGCSKPEDEKKEEGGGESSKEITISLNVPEETIADNAAVINMNTEGGFYGGMIVDAVKSSEITIDLKNDIELIQWIQTTGKKVDTVPYTSTVDKLVSDAKYVTACFVYNEKGIASKCTYTTWFAVGKVEGISESNNPGELGDNKW